MFMTFHEFAGLHISIQRDIEKINIFSTVLQQCFRSTKLVQKVIANFHDKMPDHSFCMSDKSKSIVIHMISSY